MPKQLWVSAVITIGLIAGGIGLTRHFTTSGTTANQTAKPAAKPPITASSSAENFCPSQLPFGEPGMPRDIHAVPVCHQGYASLVDSDLLVPRYVSYVLLSQHTLGCLARSDNFHVDEQLVSQRHAAPSDYVDSSYDKGHQAPAEDFAWDPTEERDSFSMANMAPQLGSLNRQGWERLEETVRFWAWAHGEVVVVDGPEVDASPQRIGADGVAVPKAFWEIVTDPRTGESLAFTMPQAAVSKKDPLEEWQVSIGEVEKQTGLTFVLPAGTKLDAKPPLWPVNLKKWRQAHKQACPAG